MSQGGKANFVGKTYKSVDMIHGHSNLQAIQSGLTVEWSSGISEGEITRLKLLKRLGYGRAGSVSSRRRALHAAVS
jgi:transposase